MEGLVDGGWYWIKQHESSQWECAQYFFTYGEPQWCLPMKDWLDDQQPFVVSLPRIMPPNL